MTPVNQSDRLLHRLTALSAPLPDADRAARVRARCCAKLERDRRRSERITAATAAARHLAPLALALLCAACLADMVGIAIRTLTV